MNRHEYRNILEALLHDLCVDWGFCDLSEDAKNELLNSNKLTSVEFAGAVLSGDGFVAEYEPKLRRKIRNKFIECFGSSLVIVSAQ